MMLLSRPSPLLALDSARRRRARPPPRRSSVSSALTRATSSTTDTAVVPYRSEYSRAAQADLAELRRRDRAAVRAEVERLLSDQPAVASTRRKRMDPNPLDVGWALRLGELRVYYDIDEAAASVWVA